MATCDDALRGGPDSGYGVSFWVGPLSGLSYNRGLFTEGGRGFQANPPAFAAARLDDALEARHIPVRLKPRAGTTPAEASVLASVDSPPMRPGSLELRPVSDGSELLALPGMGMTLAPAGAVRLSSPPVLPRSAGSLPHS